MWLNWKNWVWRPIHRIHYTCTCFVHVEKLIKIMSCSSPNASALVNQTFIISSSDRHLKICWISTVEHGSKTIRVTVHASSSEHVSCRILSYTPGLRPKITSQLFLDTDVSVSIKSWASYFSMEEVYYLLKTLAVS
jgi:hypothetical protein